MIANVRATVSRFQNVLLVAVAVVAGRVVPQFGSASTALVTPLVVFLVYSSLRGLDVRFDTLKSYAQIMAASLGISYVLLPLGGMQIANRVLSGDAIVGAAIVLAVPTTAGSAIVWTRLAGGDEQLSTGISIASLLVAPIATPAVLTLLLGSGTAVPIDSMLVDLGTIIVGGVVLLWIVPDRAIADRTVDRGTSVAILILIYSSIAGIDANGLQAVDLLPVVGVSTLLLGLGLGCAVGFGRLLGIDRAAILPLFFTSTMKNLGIGLLIAFTFSSVLVVVTIITYYVMQQFVGAIVADAVG
ncbi:MAG: bile acid:sodium symporter [Halobacteriota archaeon]